MVGLYFEHQLIIHDFEKLLKHLSFLLEKGEGQSPQPAYAEISMEFVYYCGLFTFPLDFSIILLF